MTFEEAGGKNVNPNYNSEDSGYKLNCTACVAVFEARLRGYNLEAKPYNENLKQHAKMLMAFPYYAFKSRNNSQIKGLIKFKAKNKDECIKILNNNLKEGERYIFSYFPENNHGFAHVIETAKINNKLSFFDPQCGELYSDIPNNIMYKKEDDSDFNQEYIFRVDNLDVNPEVLNQVAQPAEADNL